MIGEVFHEKYYSIVSILQKARQGLFHTWFRLSRPMTLGVRGLVENENDQVLLVRHTYTAGLYLPGGGVEKAEPAHQALERELVEEAGVQINSDAELIGVFSNHAVMRNDHVLFYRVREWTQVPVIDRGEIAEIVWASPSNPPSEATPGTGRRLLEVYGGQTPSHHW